MTSCGMPVGGGRIGKRHSDPNALGRAAVHEVRVAVDGRVAALHRPLELVAAVQAASSKRLYVRSENGSRSDQTNAPSSSLIMSDTPR
jgi:hypothetical protein